MSRDASLLAEFNPQKMKSYHMEEKWLLLAELRRALMMQGNSWTGDSVALRLCPVIEEAWWSTPEDSFTVRLSNRWWASLPAMRGMALITGKELAGFRVVRTVEQILQVIDPFFMSELYEVPWTAFGDVQFPEYLILRPDFNTLDNFDNQPVWAIRPDGQHVCDGETMTWLAPLPRGRWDFDSHPNALRDEYGEMRIRTGTTEAGAKGQLLGEIEIAGPISYYPFSYSFQLRRFDVVTSEYSLKPLDLCDDMIDQTPKIDQLILRSYRALRVARQKRLSEADVSLSTASERARLSSVNLKEQP
jgi:hypothetical protein